MKKFLLIPFLLLCLLNARGQYMSFFGDSTWEYHITYITNPPEDYVNYPPEEPNELGVYCRTYHFRYKKEHVSGVTNHFYPHPWDYNAFPHFSHLHEDTILGRLYVDNIVVCDMSLSEGDTFVLENPCLNWQVSPVDSFSAEWYLTHYPWFFDTIGDRHMLVDSVNYLSGRKNIFLSLIDHPDDYFFGSIYSNQHSFYPLSIRFIEGVGATYGFLAGCRDGRYDADLQPLMGLLLCLHKDDSLVYMADERLGCDQTCVGLNDYLQSHMNLYPNPASSYIVLDMGTGEEVDGNVTISDMLGRVCLQQHIAGTSNRISVAALPPGMYFLTYIHEQRIITRKFIKE